MNDEIIVKELIKPIRKSGIYEMGKDLSVIDYRQETAGQVMLFKSQEDYELFRDRNGLTDADFEDVDINTGGGGDLENIAYQDKKNIFQQENNFESNVNIKSSTKFIGENERIDYAYDPNSGRLEAVSLEAKDIIGDFQLATKDFVLDKTTKILGVDSTLRFYQKEVNLPAANLKYVVLWKNIDLSNIVSIQVWLKRTNNGPWMLIPNNDYSSNNFKLPFTVELSSSNGIGELQMWRLLPTDSNTWVKARINILYNGELV